MTESEWKTRKTRIDAQLKALRPAWDIIRFEEGMNTSILSHHAVEEYPTANGPADYALFVKGKLLGIIEAKKVTSALKMFLSRRNATLPEQIIQSETGGNLKFLFSILPTESKYGLRMFGIKDTTPAN